MGLVTRLLYCVISLLVLSNAVTSSYDNQYVAEVRVVVDMSGIEKWTRQTGHTLDQFPARMNATFQEMSQVYYKSLMKYQLSINLVVKDLVLLDYNLVTPHKEDKVNCWYMLSAFTKWSKKNNTWDGNKPFDLSILLTGYDLYLFAYRLGDMTSGLSTVGKVCSPGGVGVLELSGTPKDAFIAAHEIGHILGAQHDGIFPMTSSCHTSDGYVMSQTPNVTKANHVFFSPCSARLIRDNIARLEAGGENCLDLDLDRRD